MSLDQELSKEKAPEHSSGAEESERTNGSKGSLQPEAEGSPAPEAAGVASFERSSPVEWCNRFVSFGVGYALSWSGVSSCWVGCGVSRDLVRMSRLR